MSSVCCEWWWQSWLLEVGLIGEVDAAGETVLRLWCTCLHSCHQAHTKAQEGKRERLHAYYMLLLGLIKLEWCIKCILSAHILFYLLQLQNVSMHACVRNKYNSYLLCQIRILNTTQEMHHRAVLINQNWHLPSWVSFKSKVISHL